MDTHVHACMLAPSCRPMGTCITRFLHSHPHLCTHGILSFVPSIRGVATRLANDTAVLQGKLTQLGVSLISAHQMSAKTFKLASAVTVETSQVSTAWCVAVDLFEIM